MTARTATVGKRDRSRTCWPGARLALWPAPGC